jgi:RNA polymerase sigma-70 factor, ECF subfamily
MDSELFQYWQGIIKNDENAMEKLYKRTYVLLYKYARSIIGLSHISEEVVDDVLLKLWQNRSSIIITGSLLSYLYKAVHNHALNTLRQKKTLKESFHRHFPDDLWQSITDTYSLHEVITDQLFANETGEIIEKAIEKLPEQCRRIFLMFKYNDKDVHEIAKQLSLSESTVRTQIYRALHKISDILKKNL